MPGRTFKRQFTDNNKYAEFDKIPYMDALAHVVEEFVYSDKLDGDLLHFHMKEEIRMFDFMTLAAYFISESQKDFGKSTIRGFVEDLKTHSWGKNNTHVEYPEGNLFVTDASYELIMGLLWTTYIYHSACYMFSKNEKFAEISSMVYGVMVEESGLKKEAFLKGSLSENASSARKMMLSYMVRNEVRNGLKKEVAKEEPAEDSSNLQARIAELEAENKELKEQIELLQSPEGAPIDTEGHGTVRLELIRQLMDKAGAQWQKHGNKVIAAQLMAAITGLAFKTCKNHLSDPIVKHTEHKETILDVNSKLNALGIEITL